MLSDYPCFGRAECLLYLVSFLTAKLLKSIDICKKIKLKCIDIYANIC